LNGAHKKNVHGGMASIMPYERYQFIIAPAAMALSNVSCISIPGRTKSVFCESAILFAWVLA
jgi:hypothetical protein